MGGHSSGEVASSTVCQAMSESIMSNCPDAEGRFTDDDFKTSLTDAYDALDKKDNGAFKKMGTTMTFLKLHDQGCTIAHIGDSRVYHIRPGRTAEDTEILFQTLDHSLVNDLIKIGELSPEEAKTSNQRNVITRAMQPCMERRPRADIYHTSDIRPGDYFMLCSDGILEQMEDENIKHIFSEKYSDEQKVDMIIKVTEDNRDNHTAFLVHVLDVIGEAPITKPVSVDAKPIPVETKPKVNKVVPNCSTSGKTKNGGAVYILIIGVVIGVLIATAVFYFLGEEPEPVKTEKTTEANQPQKQSGGLLKKNDSQKNTESENANANDSERQVKEDSEEGKLKEDGNDDGLDDMGLQELTTPQSDSDSTVVQNPEDSVISSEKEDVEIKTNLVDSQNSNKIQD
jgi:protein phosphatase